MNFKQALENHLLSQSGLTNLIGINLFDEGFPQDFTGKGLTYDTIIAPREIAVIDPGIVYETLQFTATAPTGKECDDILTQLRLSLQNFTGIMGASGTDIGVQVDCTQCKNSGYNIIFDTSIINSKFRAADWEFDYHE